MPFSISQGQGTSKSGLPNRALLCCQQIEQISGDQLIRQAYSNRHLKSAESR